MEKTQETEKQREHKLEMVEPRQKELVTRKEDEQKPQMLRLRERNTKGDT